MKKSSTTGSGGIKTGPIIFAAMAGLLVYMISLEATGRPMPEWLLWLTTVL